MFYVKYLYILSSYDCVSHTPLWCNSWQYHLATWVLRPDDLYCWKYAGGLVRSIKFTLVVW
jgi:hypothetical protein